MMLVICLLIVDGTDVDPLLGVNENYGNYQTLGNISVALEGIGSDYENYKRSLDLMTGVHTSVYEADGNELTTQVYCSYPDQVCVYSISSRNGTVPQVTVGFENTLIDQDLFELTCGEDFTRMTGHTQVGPPIGMKYDAIARITGRPGCAAPKTECGSDGSLIITPNQGQQSVTVVIGAGTNFDQSKGNAENGYSFQGEDPAEYVEKTTADAALLGRKELLVRHLTDYQELAGAFSLDLPDPNDSANIETAALVQGYDSDGPGDPFLEALIFDYARHLLITSSRENSLPANLQGRWTEELTPAWSADYHANINLQMNYWHADQTGLSRTQDALWNYMEKNWVPRGSETAKLLYGARGWVVHNEMNIFGFTAMKDSASWAFCK